MRSVWTLGRYTRVAAVAADAGRDASLQASELAVLRRAALVADVGAVGVPTGIWEREGPLGAVARERVRLHPYLTERILGCCAGLRPLAILAGAHHERLDGSGYHRGAGAVELSRAARLLAAADTWTALSEARPHRAALPPNRARDVMQAEVRAGRLDATAVDAVLGGARPRERRLAGPAGLTEREVQVLRLIFRGAANRDVARTPGITVKTAGHYVEHIYTKIGVTSRAAAALFAMEHGLLTD